MSLSAIELARIAPCLPELRAAVPALVSDVEHATGKKCVVTSGYRTHERQQYLWDHRAENPYPVAQPGLSAHEYGGAVDIAIIGGDDSDYQQLCDIAEGKYLFHSGYPDDKVHVALNMTPQQMQAAWNTVAKDRTVTAGWLALGVVVLMLSHSKRG